MYIHFLYNKNIKRTICKGESNMTTNEQHLNLVIAACQAKRAADMQKLFSLIVAAFSFGSGCAFVWFLIGSLMAIIL